MQPPLLDLIAFTNESKGPPCRFGKRKFVHYRKLRLALPRETDLDNILN